MFKDPLYSGYDTYPDFSHTDVINGIFTVAKVEPLHGYGTGDHVDTGDYDYQGVELEEIPGWRFANDRLKPADELDEQQLSILESQNETCKELAEKLKQKMVENPKDLIGHSTTTEWGHTTYYWLRPFISHAGLGKAGKTWMVSLESESGDIQQSSVSLVKVNAKENEEYAFPADGISWDKVFSVTRDKGIFSPSTFARRLITIARSREGHDKLKGDIQGRPNLDEATVCRILLEDALSGYSDKPKSLVKTQSRDGLVTQNLEAASKKIETVDKEVERAAQRVVKQTLARVKKADFPFAARGGRMGMQKVIYSPAVYSRADELLSKYDVQLSVYRIHDRRSYEYERPEPSAITDVICVWGTKERLRGKEVTDQSDPFQDPRYFSDMQSYAHRDPIWEKYLVVPISF